MVDEPVDLFVERFAGREPLRFERAGLGLTLLRHGLTAGRDLGGQRSALVFEFDDFHGAQLCQMRAQCGDLGGKLLGFAASAEDWEPAGVVAIACARELAAFCWEAATLN
ncbi:MAG: hypothetical protein QOK49_2905 [Baekduia sp.]|nr:hypothetical protein [Baekduia sp.]